ncbi:MAG TPA: DUF1501 domain-containing protein [Burkholderiaceae bacterium]|nr:DUF1501 domain-containing protein [Burkholderiaceae bacterium]
MKPARRRFIQQGAATVAAFGWGPASIAVQTPPARLLVLLELRGGNDGLNTVVPVTDGRYFDLRPRIALRDDAVVALDRSLALHRSLAPLGALWDAREMAVIEGVGYPQPNLSHFRSIEIWDTASASNEVLQQGWLSRAASTEAFARFAADGVVIGAADLGPLAGGARAVSLADPERFVRQARLARDGQVAARGALAHVLQVEHDVVHAAAQLRPDTTLQTEFPRGAFGAAIQNAAAVASTRQVPVIRVTLAGFDTHQNQANTHAQLLHQVGEGVVALRAALQEVGLWRDTLVLTYSEFGRRPRENASAGTDHGTAAAMFAFGPRVKPGRFGAPPALGRLDENGNLPYAVDFRSVYATVLNDWFGLDAERILGHRLAPLAFLNV